jgi:hypothetical protein
MERESYIVPLWTTTGGSYLFIMLGKALHRPNGEACMYSESFSSFERSATIAMACSVVAPCLCKSSLLEKPDKPCFVSGIAVLR